MTSTARVSLNRHKYHIVSHNLKKLQISLEQWFPTFSDAFLPLLILELFFPPLWNFIPFLFGFVG